MHWLILKCTNLNFIFTLFIFWPANFCPSFVPRSYFTAQSLTDYQYIIHQQHILHRKSRLYMILFALCSGSPEPLSRVQKIAHRIVQAKHGHLRDYGLTVLSTISRIRSRSGHGVRWEKVRIHPAVPVLPRSIPQLVAWSWWEPAHVWDCCSRQHISSNAYSHRISLWEVCRNKILHTDSHNLSTDYTKIK